MVIGKFQMIRVCLAICCVGTLIAINQAADWSGYAPAYGARFGQLANTLHELYSESETDSQGCGIKWGCHKGYCWSSCDSTSFNNEWCYTTRGYSQDFHYVQCSSDSDCDRCWSCAGSCTA